MHQVFGHVFVHCLLCIAEATQHSGASPQRSAEEPQASTAAQVQAGVQQGRGPQNRPVALDTPKDQYNRHLEAARSRSGSLGPRASPRHASPMNGEAPAWALSRGLDVFPFHPLPPSVSPFCILGPASFPSGTHLLSVSIRHTMDLSSSVHSDDDAALHQFL